MGECRTCELARMNREWAISLADHGGCAGQRLVTAVLTPGAADFPSIVHARQIDGCTAQWLNDGPVIQNGTMMDNDRMTPQERERVLTDVLERTKHRLEQLDSQLRTVGIA